MRTLPPGGENERALSIEIADHLAEPRIVARHDEGVGAAAFEGERRPSTPSSRWTSLATSTSVRRAAAARSTGAASWRCSSASSRLASEMSVISRSSRLTSCSITSSSRSRLLVGLGERQGLDRRAQRGERILQLVRHVGGEALDRLDAAVERVGHVAQRAGQMRRSRRAGG